MSAVLSQESFNLLLLLLSYGLLTAYTFKSGLSLIYFVLALVIHLLRRPKINTPNSPRYPRVLTFAVLDLLFIGVYIGILSVLSAAGLPANCYGLTRQNWNVGDEPNDPLPGYTTIRFGPGLAGQRGQLDYLCPMGVGSYGLGIITMYVSDISHRFFLIANENLYSFLLFTSVLLASNLMFWSHSIGKTSNSASPEPGTKNANGAAISEVRHETTPVGETKTVGNVIIAPPCRLARKLTRPPELESRMSPMSPLPHRNESLDMESKWTECHRCSTCHCVRVMGQRFDDSSTVGDAVNDSKELTVANGLQYSRPYELAHTTSRAGKRTNTTEMPPNYFKI